MAKIYDNLPFFGIVNRSWNQQYQCLSMTDNVVQYIFTKVPMFNNYRS